MNPAKNICRSMLIVTIVTFSGCQNSYMLETEKFIIELGSRGKLLGLKSKESGQDYLSREVPSSLMSVRIDGRFYEPVSVSSSGDIFLLKYPVKGLSAKIKAAQKKYKS